MIITRLRRGNSQFPESKQKGDVVVLANGDLFCYDGSIWQLLGGRFLPKGLREEFLSYVSSGWPDPTSAKFDLPTLLDLSIFVDYGPEDIIPVDPKFVEKFINRVVEMSERCQKAK